MGRYSPSHMQISNRVIPEGLRLQPFEIFSGILCAFSGFSILIGASSSRGLERLLPGWYTILWGVTLLLGGLALSWGAASARRIEGKLIVRQVAFYRAGLRLLGATTLIYAVVLILAFGLLAFVPASLSAMFSIACYLRGQEMAHRMRPPDE